MTSTGQAAIDVAPLSSKRGEIGYVEDTHGPGITARSHSPEVVLPARHPADRDAPPAVEPIPTPASGNMFTSPSSSTLPSTTDSTAKKKRILGFLQPKKVPTFGGVRITTLLALVCQSLFAAATIVGWVLTVRRLSRKDTSSVGLPSAIVFHIIFAFVLTGQIVFLERRIFRLRAERYNFLNPGEMLPTSWNDRPTDPIIAFSPWNRPPLPTYAAALAQSGVGTGDVEDHLIAAPPPPAYGNTRGSTMLLSGYLRDSLRAQRPVSEHSQVSVGDERPISYVSEDERWEEIQNAERAQRLEETLAQLERPGSRF
jgi:hypothetical protein